MLSMKLTYSTSDKCVIHQTYTDNNNNNNIMQHEDNEERET